MQASKNGHVKIEATAGPLEYLVLRGLKTLRGGPCLLGLELLVSRTVSVNSYRFQAPGLSTSGCWPQESNAITLPREQPCRRGKPLSSEAMGGRHGAGVQVVGAGAVPDAVTARGVPTCAQQQSWRLAKGQCEPGQSPQQMNFPPNPPPAHASPGALAGAGKKGTTQPAPPQARPLGLGSVRIGQEGKL